MLFSCMRMHVSSEHVTKCGENWNPGTVPCSSFEKVEQRNRPGVPPSRGSTPWHDSGHAMMNVTCKWGEFRKIVTLLPDSALTLAGRSNIIPFIDEITNGYLSNQGRRLKWTEESKRLRSLKLISLCLTRRILSRQALRVPPEECQKTPITRNKYLI